MTKNFLRRTSSILILMLLILILAACSGGGEPSAEVEAPPAVDTAVPEPTGTEPPPPTEAPPTPEETPTTPPKPTEIPQPTPTIPLTAINGMHPDQFIILSNGTRANIREIYANGVSQGRNPNIFSILGDSLIDTPQSLAKWDGTDNTLGQYDFLQPSIDQFAGSFSRYGASVRVGLHSWSVFDPLWADKEICSANEDVLTCEIRLNNPSIMFIFLGSNDAGSPGGFNVNYRQLVEALIDQGIVPILATKADRFEGPDNANNEIIRKVAADYQLPLMEFDILADTLPGRGLSSDNVHLTYLEPLDFNSPEILARGYPVHNLASLMILDEVRREVNEGN